MTPSNYGGTTVGGILVVEEFKISWNGCRASALPYQYKGWILQYREDNLLTKQCLSLSPNVVQKLERRVLCVHIVDIHMGIVYAFQCHLMDGFPNKTVKVICMFRPVSDLIA